MGHRLLVGMAILLWMESRGSWVHSFEHSHFVFVPLPLQTVLQHKIRRPEEQTGELNWFSSTSLHTVLHESAFAVCSIKAQQQRSASCSFGFDAESDDLRLPRRSPWWSKGSAVLFQGTQKWSDRSQSVTGINFVTMNAFLILAVLIEK